MVSRPHVGLALTGLALAALACTPAPPPAAPIAAPVASPAPSAAPPAAAWPAGVPSPAEPLTTPIFSPPPMPAAYPAALARPTLPFLRASAGSQIDADPPEGELAARTAAEWRAGVARFPGLAAVAGPEPDFATTMRLLIVRHEGSYQSRLEIIGVEDLADRVVVRSVQADRYGLPASLLTSRPHDVVDCPRRDKPVTFEPPLSVHEVYLPAGRIRPVASP